MYMNMQEKDMLDDFPLPPPPNIQQQVIDIRSGVILHSSQNANKPARYMGCSAHVLLILILLAKSALFSAWLWREYENFGIGCSFLIQGFHDISLPTDHPRPKRSNDIVDILDPRIQSFKLKNPQSTVITMTNTQILPVIGAVNNPLKIKTIRQRVENIQHSEEDIEEDNSEEPMIYISPIVNRLSGLPDPLRKHRKGKGKGRKTSTTTTTEPPLVTEKKKDRKNKKNRKKNRGDGVTDQTKAPRHLFTVDSSPVTTISPLRTQKQLSSPNQGHLRNFKMQKANQKPKKPKDNSNDGIKLSKETRLMWEMDELNFTTFATSSLHSSSDKRLIADDNDDPNIQIIQKNQIVVFSPSYSVDPLTNTTLKYQITTTTSSSLQQNSKNFHIKPEQIYYDDDDLQVVLVENKNRQSHKATTQQPVAVYYESVKATPPSPEWFLTTLNELQRHASSLQTTTPIPTFSSTKRPKPIKHGFDRSQDKSIDDGLMDFPSAISKHRAAEENHSIPFQDQLSSFTTSAVCVARALFDVWCVCQLLTAFPFSFGICLARRALFVAHLVLDILFLVIGFIFSITTIVFSIILYVLVGEMRRSTLFYWLLFAVIVDVVLVAYSATVIVSMRCCERIVRRRKNTRVSSNGETV